MVHVTLCERVFKDKVVSFHFQEVLSVQMLTRAVIENAVKQLSFRTNCFINGSFVPAISKQTFVTENPANGTVLAHIAAGDKDDIDAAVKV